jgi:hypothetical protein
MIHNPGWAPLPNRLVPIGFYASRQPSPGNPVPATQSRDVEMISITTRSVSKGIPGILSLAHAAGWDFEDFPIKVISKSWH